MLNKILSYIFFVISIIGIIYCFKLINEASQPCGSDGCLIHILFLIAIPGLIIFGLLFYFTLKNIRSYQKEKIQENE